MEKRCVVLLMRPTPDYGELSSIGEIVWIPVVRLIPRENCSLKVLEAIKYYDIVTITSPRTLLILLEDAKKHNIVEKLLRSLRKVKVAAIGPVTAKSLGKYGIKPTILPPVHDSKHLGIEIARRASTEKVLIIRSAQATEDLNKELSKAGISYREIHVYDVKINWDAALKAAKLIMEGRVNYTVITSPSIAKAICNYLRNKKHKSIFIAIGETTRRAIKQYCDIDEVLLPTTSTLKGIAKLLSEHCLKR